MPTRIPFSNNRHAGHADADADRYVYRLIPQTPELDARELESSDSTLEIVILWGGMSVLHVAHLSPPRAFYVGDDPQRDDFLIGADTLGSERLPIVLESEGELSLVVPRGASGEIERGEERIALPAHDSGTQRFPLRRGDCGRVLHGDFTFVVRSVAAARPELGALRAKPDVRNSRWTLASASMHALLLLSFYFLPPTSSALSLDLLHTDSRLVHTFIEARENRIEEPPKWLDDAANAAAAGGGEPAEGPQGAAGARDSRERNRRMAVKGHDQPLQLSREELEEQALKADLFAVLRAQVGSLAPSSPYSSEAAQGSDAENALGALLGNETGASFGWGGLSGIGVGRGGGGTAQGTLAVGPANTRGPGWGGAAAVGGFRDRKTSLPKIRSGVVDTVGSLSKETIRRVINRHINEIRFCYEQQLNAHPDLQGRVSAKFIIAPTGAVQTAMISESDLGNPTAEKCVKDAVARWIFPAPEGGGVVVVTYPFLFSQAGT